MGSRDRRSLTLEHHGTSDSAPGIWALDSGSNCRSLRGIRPITDTYFNVSPRGYHPDPAPSLSLRAEAYTDPRWSEYEQTAFFVRTWQLASSPSSATLGATSPLWWRASPPV